MAAKETGVKLDTRAFATAVGAVNALLYLVCAALVALVPQPLTTLVGYLIHADMSTLQRAVTWTSTGIGLVAWTLLTALAAGLIAGFYNRLVEGEREEVVQRERAGAH